MSYIGNTPGVSSQRVVLEEVISGSAKSAFTPISGYTLGYVDVLVNGVEIDAADFTATDGVTVTLVNAAQVGDTVKIKTWLPRGLSDGYLKSESDAKYVALTGDQTVAGVKTLSSNPILSGGTANGVGYLNGSKVLTTGSALTFDGTTLNFGGTAQRISADMSNATVSNRLLFQSSTANGASRIHVIPNGTGTASAFAVLNSSDADNASWLQIQATASVAQIAATNSGTGSYLPLTFVTNGAEQMRLTSTGLGIGTSSPGYKLTVNGFTAVAGPIGAFKQSAETSAFYGVAVQRSTNDSTLGMAFNSGADAWQLSASYSSSGAYKPIQLLTSDAVRVTLDTSGNLGLGVTPSAWGTTYTSKVLQVGAVSSVFTNTFDNSTHFGSNFYDAGGSVKTRIADGYASEYRMVSGQHQWATAASNTAGTSVTFTQAMTLDASGNFKVGTTTFGTRAAIAGTNTAVSTTVGGSNTGLMFLYDTASTTGSGPEMVMGCSYDGTNSIVGTSIKSYKEASTGSGSDQYNHSLIFKTSSYPSGLTERARIDSSGNLLVGTTNAAQNATVGLKFVYNATAPTINSVWNLSSAATTYHLYNENATNNGYRFYVNVNGGISNYSGNNSNLSDERTKTNIELASGYLEKICAIPVKLFNYKDEAEGEQRTLGVIAQDVELVAPELVNTDGWLDGAPEGEEPLKSVYTTDMMFALMKCIQEQQAIIEQLRADVETLKGQA